MGLCQVGGPLFRGLQTPLIRVVLGLTPRKCRAHGLNKTQGQCLGTTLLLADLPSGGDGSDGRRWMVECLEYVVGFRLRAVSHGNNSTGPLASSGLVRLSRFQVPVPVSLRKKNGPTPHAPAPPTLKLPPTTTSANQHHRRSVAATSSLFGLYRVSHSFITSLHSLCVHRVAAASRLMHALGRLDPLGGDL